MQRVRIKAYLSPSLVLLALNWADGAQRDDFLGFAIRRAPGFGDEPESWLPNRIGFDGPARGDVDFPSNEAPIQKFQWWDARIDTGDRGRQFTYTAWPVVGRPGDLRLLQSASAKRTVTLPQAVEDGIGTWFNRAVVSSQAFTRRFLRDGRPLTEERLGEVFDWLSNGMREVVPEFLDGDVPTDGAIYHLTDEEWIIPAFAGREPDATEMVYDATTKEDGGAETNAAALEALAGAVRFHPRTRAKIMHDKFLVRGRDGAAEALMMGSANFTTGGLTTQANVMHTFASPRLAELYRERRKLLEQNLTLGKTAAHSGWSEVVEVADARVRVFFSPEPTKRRESIDTIIRAIEAAKSSVLFCLFSPTDKALRDALFAAGDRGLMMFGLINQISKPKPDATPDAMHEARVATYNRSRDSRDVYAHAAFPASVRDKGFWFEVTAIPGQPRARFPVHIHHKFIVIDAETDDPTVYTGSANMSAGSLHNNDENLLEVKGRTAFAHAYLAEFMRLYEHYRARAREQRDDPPGGRRRERARAVPCRRGFALAHTACWAEDDYTPGTPQCKSRTAMAD